MNKFNIDLKEYQDKKPIGHYDILVTNCCYHTIDLVDLVYCYGVYVAVYYANCNVDGFTKKLRYAVLKENNTLNVIDYFNKRHCISYNQFYRY